MDQRNRAGIGAVVITACAAAFVIYMALKVREIFEDKPPAAQTADQVKAAVAAKQADAQAKEAREKKRAIGIEARTKAAAAAAEGFSIKAEASGIDGNVLVLHPNRCSEAFLGDVIRIIGVDRMRAVGFQAVSCVDAGMARASRYLF